MTTGSLASQPPPRQCRLRSGVLSRSRRPGVRTRRSPVPSAEPACGRRFCLASRSRHHRPPDTGRPSGSHRRNQPCDHRRRSGSTSRWCSSTIECRLFHIRMSGHFRRSSPQRSSIWICTCRCWIRTRRSRTRPLTTCSSRPGCGPSSSTSPRCGVIATARRGRAIGSFASSFSTRCCCRRGAALPSTGGIAERWKVSQSGSSPDF